MLACLHLTDTGSLTAAELIHRLRVSPASISKAVGYLEGLALLRRARPPATPRTLRPRRRRLVPVLDGEHPVERTRGRPRPNGDDALGAETPAGARMDGVHRFFESLHHDMTGAVARLTAGDALTALAALVHAAGPLTIHEPATALNWPPDRVTKALRHTEEFPDIAGPITLHRTKTGAWTTTARLTLLTPPPREALNQAQP